MNIGGAAFDIRVRDNLAEAIRTNAQYAPRRGSLAAQATFAMETVSGCKVRDLKGDQTYLIGQLDCDGSGEVYRPARGAGSTELECLTLDAYVSAATGEHVLDLECDPVF